MFKKAKVVVNVLFEDFFNGRFRASIFLGIANFLPDLIVVGYFRPFLWRAAGVKIPLTGKSFIRKNVWVDSPSELYVGRQFQANRGVIISAHGGILIGDNVTLSYYVGIHSIAHQGTKHEIDKLSKVIIGGGCIIYSHAVILPGSVLQQNTIVAAGSVLRGQTEPHSIYSGNLAVKVSTRKYD
ncbi:MAG: hypothetical protein H7Y13_07760 [Sphingobacteriaceae bacterium]|nr:hypothetical protein [Sphingobacteriaceae bacterium]